MRSRPKAFLSRIAVLVLLVPVAHSQQLPGNERALAQTMLDQVSSDVRHEYYDPKLHGLDWNALVRQTKLKIDQANDITVANAEIAALLESLNDSHTFFFPPRYLKSVDYGWKFQMFGDHCYVTEVHLGSDAEKKGMKPGDEVLTINGFTIDRESIARMQYAMNILIPSSVLRIVFRNSVGTVRQVDVQSAIQKNEAVIGLGGNDRDIWWHRIEEEKRMESGHPQYKEFGQELMILRVPAFYQTGLEVDGLFKKAREHKTLIIDLRGTPGGALNSMLAYLGDVFDQDFKASDLVTRTKTQPLMVKSNHHALFSGNLIVLVDSETASAGEIFSRVVQLEHRGTILGDRTSGQVMASQHFEHELTSNVTYIYGDSVTVSDMIMSDGKSLERTGVTPDRTLLPTASDLFNKRDTVLSSSSESAGVALSPEDAAKIFPKQ